MLPYEIVPPHEKPAVRPSIPINFPLSENFQHLSVINSPKEAIETADEVKFAISLVRCGLDGHVPGQLPPWNGIHALTTK